MNMKLPHPLDFRLNRDTDAAVTASAAVVVGFIQAAKVISRHVVDNM